MNTRARRAMALLLCLPAFGNCISTDRSDCPTGVYVRLYSQTPCDNAPSYPGLPDVRMYVFDADEVLVGWQEEDPGIVLGVGTYTVVAWAGLDSGSYDLTIPVENTTTKGDVLFHIQRVGQQAGDTDGSKVWFGESAPVEVSRGPGEPFFKDVEVNMQEITNRVTVSVEGLDDPDDYQAVIESDTGSMNFDGTIAPDTEIFYAGLSEVRDDDLHTRFTVLELAEGYENTLIVRSEAGAELFRGDLLAELLEKNPLLNLACDHDFDIVFQVGGTGDGTYVMVKIYVNGWLTHSYSTDVRR